MNQRTRKVKLRNDATPKALIYHYDLEGNLISETREDGRAIREYIWANQTPIVQIKVRRDNKGVLNQQKLLYLHTDHLNTPRIATNPTGIVVWRWESRAFGDYKIEKDPDGDGTNVNVRLRFPGQFKDGESGLYYNWNRYYDPRMGRYITSDRIGLNGGLNTYAYVGNNPVFWADPTGLDVWDDGGIGNSPGENYIPPGNGNPFGGFTPQDGVCTGPVVGTLDNNPCTKQCCIDHDNCFEKYGCNAKSWWGNLNGWLGACQVCNSVVKDCVQRNLGKTDCDDDKCGG